jgi:hypothetical protein
MDFWINTWTVFFFCSLTIFAGMAIVVTIGGFFNIKDLFKGLLEEAEKMKAKEGTSESNEDKI